MHAIQLSTQGSFVINDFLSMDAMKSIDNSVFEIPKDVHCHGVPGGFVVGQFASEIERLENTAEISDAGEESIAPHTAARLLKAFSADIELAFAVADNKYGREPAITI